MIRVLFIARYHDSTMRRKLELLAARPDLILCHISPRAWHNELTHVKLDTTAQAAYRQMVVDIYRSADPHRALYRTFTFGLRDFQPHIIHAEEEPDSLPALQIAVARRLFAPRAKLLLNTWQNIDRPMKKHIRVIRSIALKASDGMVCANTEAQQILRHQGYSKQLLVVPAIGVDTSIFMPAEPTQHDRFTIAYLGRLITAKGLSTLIDAVEQLVRSDIKQPMRLLIVGDGAQREETMHYAEKLGDIVQFTPPVLPAQVAQQFHEIDVLVLPSRTTPVWKEQFGRVLAEAMACRVPVIGSSSGAIPEVIGDTGLVFPEGDVAALANCLRQLIDSPDLRRDLAQRGYNRVMTNYTQEHIALQTATFYRQIMKA